MQLKDFYYFALWIFMYKFLKFENNWIMILIGASEMSLQMPSDPSFQHHLVWMKWRSEMWHNYLFLVSHIIPSKKENPIDCPSCV